MEFTSKMMAEFLTDIIAFNKESTSYINISKQIIEDRKEAERLEWNEVKKIADKVVSDTTKNNTDISKEYESRIGTLLRKDLEGKKGIYTRLCKCKEALAIIANAESSIVDKAAYDINKTDQKYPTNVSIDELISGKVDFISLAYNVNQALKGGRKSKGNKVCTQFYCLCRDSESLLIQECENLRKPIVENLDKLHGEYNGIRENIKGDFEKEVKVAVTKIESLAEEFASQYNESKLETVNTVNKTIYTREERLQKLCNNFCSKFPPREMAEEYKRIYSIEPIFDKYECVENMPRNVYISSIEVDISNLKLSDYTISFLERYYYFMYSGKKLHLPHCAHFGSEFNYIFRFEGEGRKNVVKDACNLGMRLFMLLPPGKVNFTFIDPVTLGESFAMFTRLVDVNDRTSEIINGKIWSDPSDIEDKLRVMTDHIANVTQRCLQGKYDTIYEYNQDAEQNAEAYQIIMLMDFPTGLTDQSLKLLEQISTSGPKCGVFTILYKNESQLEKISERSYPLVSNIEKCFQVFDYSKSCDEIICPNDKFDEGVLKWKVRPLPNQDRLDDIIEKLKMGIKNAERVVVNFSKIIPPKEEWFQGDCASELSIPIGVHGANNIQNLSFGVGGSHHALVAGQTGSGKSSLLHTIIMSALIKYPANQLQVFLVDFKRGVEFKIYANYNLENFKVIAIESEREFGCSVLEYLDKEQSRRADKFKKINVDNVEDYRKVSGEILPRILLIIDEFHVLFSKDTSDINSKNSSAYLEQIIRQGRAFGIHIILASQTMSNIGGINYGVWGQVGVRIALKCPKSDAKFVLGSENDGVNLLSGDNPGQAIYNSDCGNVIANTVFRVAYIDQNEQIDYLQYISNNEPKFNYPSTRVMLSNVEDNIYSPLQRFAYGENYSFADNAILVGEPLKLINNMKMVFKQKQGSNMLVIGNDEQKARTLFTFAALSLSLHVLTKNSYHCPNAPTIYLFDYAPLEVFEEKDDSLLTLAKNLPRFIKYIPFDESEEAMKELYQVFKQREKGSEQNEELYMFVYGLQRARSLRSSDIYKKNIKYEEFDEFGENVYQEGRGYSSQEYLTVKPYDMFLNLLQRGALFGINAIIWEDNFKLFMNSYADMLSNFDMRIAFTMPDDDSINFIEEVNGSKISENGAIYNYNGNQKFRPYKKPDSDWLENICTRITQFESK